MEVYAGEQLVLKSGATVSAQEALAGKKVIALYFSAHWYVLNLTAIALMRRVGDNIIFVVNVKVSPMSPVHATAPPGLPDEQHDQVRLGLRLVRPVLPGPAVLHEGGARGVAGRYCRKPTGAVGKLH